MVSDFYGNLGDIWLYSESNRIYKAVMFKRNGDEQIHTFPAKDLQKWINKLEVPASPSKQAHFKNHFLRTFEDIQERFKTSKEAKNQKIKYLKLKAISDEIFS